EPGVSTSASLPFPVDTSPTVEANTSDPGRRGRAGLWWAAGAPSIALVAAFLLAGRISNSARGSAGGVPPPPLHTSVSVLPLLDLTEKMSEEEFADGLTEEVIDRLARVHGIRVPPPTSSFYFKNKRRSVAEIARALDVSYVLDGSTRKSGARLRVAARLIRA